MKKNIFNNDEFIRWIMYNTCCGVECGWKYTIDEDGDMRIIEEGNPLAFCLRWQMNALDGEEYLAPLACYGVYENTRTIGGEYDGHKIDADGAIKAMINKASGSIKEFIIENTKDEKGKKLLREFLMDYMNHRFECDKYFTLPLDVKQIVECFLLKRI